MVAPHQLYSWQHRLLSEWFARGRTPDAVDIPTGLGKTTVIALWLAALASGAPLPRRLVYVVDRRAVVDQATEEATRVAGRLGSGSSSEPLVAAIRQGLGLRVGQILPVSTLRGQYVDNRQWLEHPGLAAIVVGTVDMIGSRLLFSGYGISRRMRPVHAGLLGVDTLVVLDEAHLVPPFEALARQISALRRPAYREMRFPPMRVLSLSATGRTDGDVFRLGEEDLADPRVRARLDAGKRLAVEREVPSKDLSDVLAARAWEMGQPSSAVVVYCNSRKIAMQVAALLRSRARGAYGKEADVVALLVGERRFRERQRLSVTSAFQQFKAGSPRAERDLPAFLVATSAGEVGVDLDADHMVCDLVAWERMVQRLGRVNRRPVSSHVARITVIPAEAATAKDEAEQEINAARLKQFLAPFQLAEWPADTTGIRDASTGALYRLKQHAPLDPVFAGASTPEPLHPPLTFPLAQALAMTSLHEHAGRPEILPWLRGWVDELPQSRVVWRRLLPVRGDLANTSDLEAFLEEAPPHLSEMLEAPAAKVAAVIRRRVAAWLDGDQERDVLQQGVVQDRLVIVVLAPDNTVDVVLDPAGVARLKNEQLERMLRNRTIILDARLGGLDEDGLLDPAAVGSPTTLDSHKSSWTEHHEIGFRVRVARADDDDGAWRPVFRWPRFDEDESEAREELRVEVLRAGSATTGDPAVSRAEQELEAHVADVLRAVRETTRQLRLLDPVPTMFDAVATMHDSGKRRELWQRAMGAPRDGKTYAKTRGGGNPRLLQIGGETYRHEFGSVRDVVDAGAFDGQPPSLRELALHLVAVHHGEGRPIVAPVDPDHPPSLSLPLAKDVARRFDRLNGAFGPWELAWLEALFRAADWKGSAAQQQAEVP
jgi:CRISPR-associated endonuclease/helicase Cas3